MILGQAKNARSGRALRAGGERPLGSWRPPAERTGGVVFACRRTRGPLWAEGPTPRAQARAAGGGPGEGKAQMSGKSDPQCTTASLGIFQLRKDGASGPERALDGACGAELTGWRQDPSARLLAPLWGAHFQPGGASVVRKRRYDSQPAGAKNRCRL